MDGTAPKPTQRKKRANSDDTTVTESQPNKKQKLLPNKKEDEVVLPPGFIRTGGWELQLARTAKCGRCNVKCTSDNPLEVCGEAGCTYTLCWKCRDAVGHGHPCVDQRRRAPARAAKTAHKSVSAIEPVRKPRVARTKRVPPLAPKPVPQLQTADQAASDAANALLSLSGSSATPSVSHGAEKNGGACVGSSGIVADGSKMVGTGPQNRSSKESLARDSERIGYYIREQNVIASTGLPVDAPIPPYVNITRPVDVRHGQQVNHAPRVDPKVRTAVKADNGFRKGGTTLESQSHPEQSQSFTQLMKEIAQYREETGRGPGHEHGSTSYNQSHYEEQDLPEDFRGDEPQDMARQYRLYPPMYPYPSNNFEDIHAKMLELCRLYLNAERTEHPHLRNVMASILFSRGMEI